MSKRERNERGWKKKKKTKKKKKKKVTESDVLRVLEKKEEY